MCDTKKAHHHHTKENAILISETFSKPKCGRNWGISQRREVTHNGCEYGHC